MVRVLSGLSSVELATVQALVDTWVSNYRPPPRPSVTDTIRRCTQRCAAVLVTTDTHILDASPYLANRLGYTQRELTGQSLTLIRAGVSHLPRDPRPFIAQGTLRHKAGHLVPYHTQAVPIADGTGQIVWLAYFDLEPG